jgi:hypothetical protein
VKTQNRYQQLIERIFLTYYREGLEEIVFKRSDLESAAQALNIELPKNLGDVIYSFRYRALLPASVLALAPPGKSWIIRPAGRALYKFVTVLDRPLVPQALLVQIKLPDATPGIVARYSRSDEQALLAKVRYNRLIDIFTGVTCYSLQNHLRTTVADMGQVETDEIYVGVDRHGGQYVFPVQAKSGADRLSIVQIEQDFAVCAQKFPGLICRAVAAQFMTDDVIVLFAFEMDDAGVVLTDEKHYRLVSPNEISAEELHTYQLRGRGG